MHTLASRRMQSSLARYRLFIGIIAGASALAAHAAEPQTMKLTMEAQKNYFAEKCFKLGRGQQLAYQVSTRHPIDFNLHHHPEGGDTVFPDRLVVKSQHSKQIIAESAGSYCFMATNLNDQPGGFEVVINFQITSQ